MDTKTSLMGNNVLNRDNDLLNASNMPNVLNTNSNVLNTNSNVLNMSHTVSNVLTVTGQGDNGSNMDTNDNLQEFDDYYNIEYRVRTMLAQPHEIIAITTGLIAVSLNLLIFAGMYHVKNRMTTHYRLIISLAASDLIVGGSVTAHIINKVLNPVYKPGEGMETQRLLSKCSFLVIKALNTTGLNVTLLNLMAMALDHYVAIIKPLQYPSMMTRKRVLFSIIFLWLISIFLGFSDFFSAFRIHPEYKAKYNYNYCETVWHSKYHEEYTVLAVAPVCFVAMFYTYTKIYFKVRKHQRPGEAGKHRTRQRTPKALITTLLNLGTFVVTWLPMCLFQVIMLVQVHYSPQQIQDNLDVLADVDKYLYDLLLINSIADSIIYTVRIHDVKVGLYKLFRGGSPDRAFNRSVSMSLRFKHSGRSCSALPQELETFA